MTTRPRTLDSYLQIVRDAPATTDADMRSLLDPRPAPSHLSKPFVRWAAAGASVGAIALMALLATSEPDRTAPPITKPTATSARSHSPTIVPTPPDTGVASSTTTMEQPATSNERRWSRPHAVDTKGTTPGSTLRRVSMPIEVDGIRMVELSESELAGIGVRVRADGSVECFTKDISHWTTNHTQDTVVLRTGRMIVEEEEGRTMQIDADDFPRGIEAAVPPHLVTDAAGRRIPILQDRRGMSKRVAHLLDSLERIEFERPYPVDGLIAIPVGSGATRKILWYEPSEALFAHLPPCLADQLRLEHAAAVRADDEARATMEVRFREQIAPRLRRLYDSLRSLQPTERLPCIPTSNAVTGAGYLDIWRSGSASVSMSAPIAEGNGDLSNVGYSLSEPRTVSIGVHDMSGRRRLVVVENERREAGRWRAAIDLGELPAGIYLVVLSTDNGEQAVQRISK